MNVHAKRYILPSLAAAALLALGGALALGHASPASARMVNAQQATSQNWAGYVARSNAGNGQFSTVSGSWIVPTASSSSSTGQGQGYSAFWIGLGGSSDQSQALEQTGTSSDWVNGQAQYYAWYELVPAPETRLDLAVHPGDHMSANVSVNGSTVTVSLSDRTTGQSVTKQLQMSNPDTSSAEWIAEAPSSMSGGGNYQTLPLADFGKVTFTGASATADGHTGSISDPQWSVQQVELASPSGGDWAGGGAGIAANGAGFVSDSSSAGAQTSSLSGDGTSFSVSWTPDGSALAGSSGAGAGAAAGGGASTSGGSTDPYGYGGTGGAYGYGGGGDPYGYGGGGDSYGYGGGGDPYGYGGAGGSGGYVVPTPGGGYAIVTPGGDGYGI